MYAGNPDRKTSLKIRPKETLGVHFRPLRTISYAKWQNNGIAVLLSEQWAGIVVRPGREGRLCAVRVQICQTFR